MRIARRTFVLGGGLTAAAVKLALLGVQGHPARAATPMATTIATAPAAVAVDLTPAFAFRIFGWDADADEGAAEAVWLAVGHGWRTAWR